MRRDIGELLLENGQITEAELKQALQEVESTAEPIGRALIRLGLVNEDNLKTVLELNYGVSYLDLRKTMPEMRTVGLLPKQMAFDYDAVPVQTTGNRLTLAMVSPSDNESLAVIAEYLKDWQVNLVVCSDDGFQDFISKAYPLQEEDNQEDVIDLDNALDPEAAQEDASLNEGRAIVLLCHHILANAISRGCTNIHIEPAERQILVHYRKQGVLFAARKLPKAILPDLVQRFKIMVTKTGQESPIPYDGVLNVRYNNQNFACRLSIVPGTYGEHLVVWLE